MQAKALLRKTDNGKGMRKPMQCKILPLTSHPRSKITHPVKNYGLLRGTGLHCRCYQKELNQKHRGCYWHLMLNRKQAKQKQEERWGLCCLYWQTSQGVGTVFNIPLMKNFKSNAQSHDTEVDELLLERSSSGYIFLKQL